MAKNNNLKDYLVDLYQGIASRKPNASKNPQDFRSEIENLVFTSDANAAASDIRAGKTAYVNDVKITGTIEDYDERTENGLFVYDTLTASLRNELTSYGSDFIPSIPNETFQGCTNLQKVWLPYTLEVGDYAFDGCTSLYDLYTRQLDQIGIYAFRNTNFSSIDFPYITSIGYGAFMNCKALTSISIGTKTTSIVTSGMSMEKSMEDLCNGCANLQTFELKVPTSSIIYQFTPTSFAGCTSLTEVILSGEVRNFMPHYLSYDIFSDCDKSKLSIYVDDAYLSAFKTNEFWSKYSSIIKPVSTR